MGGMRRIINNGTWMIGGPAFDADVPRFGELRSGDGHAPRPRLAPGVRRSLRLPLEGLRTNIACPRTLARESMPPESDFSSTVKSACITRVFIVRKAAARAKAPIAFLCSTNSWRAYAATPFSPTWPGLKKSIGNNGFANSPGDPPALLLLSTASRRSGDVSDRLQDALADRRPVHTHGPRRMGLQPSLPARPVHPGLAGDAGLRLRRPERHRPASRSATSSTATRCCSSSGTANTGRSRRWTAVSRFLDQGGNAVVLSGNTAFWRVSFNADA